MTPSPPLPDEAARLEALIGLHILDTPPETRFDRITRLAAHIFGVPIALVSLVDTDRQWFKSRVGLDAPETSRDISFCGHAIAASEIFVVEDAAGDERFCDNPLVMGDPNIRFYAGCPLTAAGGHRVGTLCIIDRRPRTLDATQRAALRDLAAIAENELNAIELNTALQRQRESEQKLDDLRRKFCAVAAHELRTPLATVHGFAELLAQREFSEPERRDLLQRMVRQSGHLMELINKMLDLMRIEAGKAEDFHLRPESIEDIVRQAASRLDGIGASERIRIDVPAGLPTLMCDADQLQQVIVNILSNSLKYSNSESEITISASVDEDKSGHQMVICVADRGIGMTPEQLSRVCERFYRANPGNAITGTGLGMSIVKEIVELHCGTLSIHSEPGHGTKVYARLPVAPHTTVRPGHDDKEQVPRPAEEVPPSRHNQ